MRRIAAHLVLAAVTASCSPSEPTATTAAGPAPTTPQTTTAPATTTQSPPTTTDACRDVQPDLIGYLEALGIQDVSLDSVNAGPFSSDLPNPESFAAELGTGCAAEFLYQSSFGEMAHVVAAWDRTKTHAALGALVRPDLAGDLPEVEADFIVDFDGLQRARLYPAGDDLLWGTIDDWSTVWTLRSIAGIAGDDPLEALGGWHRAKATAGIPTLVMGTSSGWGASAITFVVSGDGDLIALTDQGGFPRTFAAARKVVSLGPAELEEVRTRAAATGVTTGDGWHRDESIMDAGSLWLRYRADDVSYYGLVYAPRLGEDTPARQSIIDLSAHLEELAANAEGSLWVPESIVVYVDQQGPPGEDGNIVPWPGSLDLAAAAERGCVLLDGAGAAGYVDELSIIIDDWRGRDRTVFEYAGATYRVHAEGVLPGDPEGLLDGLSECDEDGYISADPGLLSWLWSARGIDEYQMSLRVECSGCDAVVTLDLQTTTVLPGWGDFRTVDDLFDLAKRDEVELVELTTDGLVGIPVVIEVMSPDGEALRLQTTKFESDGGLLRVGFDTGMAITGFDEWIPEGY